MLSYPICIVVCQLESPKQVIEQPLITSKYPVAYQLINLGYGHCHSLLLL